MFTTRCFCCGMLIHNGMPTLDMLTADQAMAVGTTDLEGSLKRDVLRGTPFEGMSTGSFCEFCLVMIAEFPSVFDKTNESPTWTETKEMIEAISGQKAMDWEVESGPFVNRTMRLAMGKHIYRNGDFSLAESLLTVGIEKDFIICGFPGCNEVIGFYNPRRAHPHNTCMAHQYRVTIGTLMGMEILHSIRQALSPDPHIVTRIPQDSCDCHPCQELSFEYWEIDYEEYQERVATGEEPF